MRKKFPSPLRINDEDFLIYLEAIPHRLNCNNSVGNACKALKLWKAKTIFQNLSSWITCHLTALLWRKVWFNGIIKRIRLFNISFNYFSRSIHHTLHRFSAAGQPIQYGLTYTTWANLVSIFYFLLIPITCTFNFLPNEFAISKIQFFCLSTFPMYGTIIYCP